MVSCSARPRGRQEGGSRASNRRDKGHAGARLGVVGPGLCSERAKPRWARIFQMTVGSWCQKCAESVT